MGAGGGSHQTNEQEFVGLAKLEGHLRALVAHARDTERGIGTFFRREAGMSGCRQKSKQFANRGFARGLGRALHRLDIVRAFAAGNLPQTNAHAPVAFAIGSNNYFLRSPCMEIATDGRNS